MFFSQSTSLKFPRMFLLSMQNTELDLCRYRVQPEKWMEIRYPTSEGIWEFRSGTFNEIGIVVP